jgi:hypothetical protein
MKKWIRVVLIALAGMLAITFVYLGVLVYDTRGVMADARAVFLHGETGYGALDAYAHYANDAETADVELSLFRFFTWHDFWHGYILVHYTCSAIDAAGNTICGSYGIDACWEIQMIDGRWAVMNVMEAP